MTKLPKYICFRVVPTGKGVGFELRKIHPYEMEETACWRRCEDDTCYWFECSACGHEPLYTRYKQEILSDYCPYCGCLMLEEGNDDKD